MMLVFFSVSCPSAPTAAKFLKQSTKASTHIIVRTHIIYIVCLLALISSCGPGGSNFRIKGTFRDMQEGELYVYNLDNDQACFDTINVQEGRFLYKGQARSTVPYMLVFPNGVEQVIFVGPGADLTYEATANDLKNYVVNGSDENKLMNEFRKETYAMDAPRTTNAARDFIHQHPESYAALYLLDRYFAQEENVSDTELSKLIKIVKAQHPGNSYLLSMENKVRQASKHAEGATVPDMTLRTAKDKYVKLWDSKKAKTYTLITFWSVWSIDGYDQMWKMREYSSQYKESGKLRIVAISLDVERYRWEEATRQDSTTIIEHYCDGKAFESDVVKTLGVTNVPSYLLVDRSHKIIDQSSDMSSLGSSLEKHLGKSKISKDDTENDNL